MPYIVMGDLLCWIWSGYCGPDGTPTVRTKTSTTTGRRWHWEREVGPIPEGHVLIPLCGAKLCVRPRHMKPVLPEEVKIWSGQTVLSPELAARALLMRRMGISGREVARRFGVDEKTIRRIQTGDHWTVRKEGRNGGSARGRHGSAAAAPVAAGNGGRNGGGGR